MEFSKTKFEKKKINGKKNPKYVDLLDEDKPISGQKFACVSFCSPEQILKKREMFFFEQFLKKWELNKSMEKFVQFLNFISFKYNLSFEDLSKDFKDFVQEEKDILSRTTFDDEYKTFLDNSEEELQKKFDIEHNFQTNTRGIKIRGSYPTQEEAELRAKMLREIDDSHDIFVGPVGMWMPWDPEAYKTGKVEYMEEELNQLMSEKKKNDTIAKTAFEERLKETKQKAIDENIKNAEKTGNTLTQTIDKEGNLIGINNVNTQEKTLSENENLSASDICRELFEGENIVIGKTDNGQSQLQSGPFSNKKND
jgi:ribosomal protein L18